MRLTDQEIEQRIADGEAFGWDLHKLAEKWNRSYEACKSFMLKYRPGEVGRTEKPEYENQELFDLQVLTAEEYMRKYKMGPYTYNWKLTYYSALCGEEIATPEIREQWMQEYWRNL